ncbi:MAG: amino acid ABC transporter permease [Candidatus Cloacimonadota bacterium]|nr:MAG: amino acid ABC transporter permease [Candidatus Cloacimonadota bacterium]PIE79264.1 MAG: amino acid ABC transporter permease [Candidatus Delongbacteria bacterium]
MGNFFKKSLFSNEEYNTNIIYKIINISITLLFLSIIFWLGFKNLGYELHWENLFEYRKSLTEGLINTIYISATSLVLSLIIGIIFGVGQRSFFLPFKYFSRVYIEIIRGTPLLVQILIFFYVIANAVGINERFTVGVVIMSLFSGAYIAEIVRSGVESIGKSQWETAKSLGFTKIQTYRFMVFPQVFTRILPPLAGQFASLIKDSSLLSIIAIKEFTMAAREMNANTFSTLEAYVPLAVGYLILTLPISWLSRELEKKYKYET